jgi:hypothetical protein
MSENTMTEAEKILWQCYHARAMQGMLSNSALKYPNQGEGEFIDSCVADASMAADSMLAEAKKRGCV